MESNGINNTNGSRRTAGSQSAFDDKTLQRQKNEPPHAEKDAKDIINDNNIVNQHQKNTDVQQIAPAASSNVSINGSDASDEDATTQQTVLATLPSSTSGILSKHHQLKSKWTFWFLNNKKGMDWLERLSNVCTISTVEEFWAFFDNIRPPSGMFGCDYNFFREGIQPLWEVKENKDGGRLVVQVDKQRNDLLDNWWLELLMACIGEQFGDVSDQICGAVCNIRQKGSKISIWTTNAMDDEKNRRIGQVIKDRLQDAPGANMGKPHLKVHFEDHVVVQQKTSSAIPSRFIL